MKKYSILIIEDHSLTRFGLRTAFESDKNFSKIYEAANAKQGISIAQKEAIDAVIMDLGLPDINGIEATKIIKEKHPSIKVVILSSHEQEEDVLKSLHNGANAYCTKDIEPDKLIDITKSILEGAAWFDPKVAQYVLNAARRTENEVKEPPVSANSEAPKSTENNLTVREKQVLALIVEGLTNNEIAKKLDVSINTTKAHVCNILQKLAVNDRTQAAIKALKDNLI